MEGPSQIRYVHYLEAVLYCGVDPLEMYKVLFSKITLPVSEVHAHRPLHVSVMVRCQRYPIFDSCNKDVDTVWKVSGQAGELSCCWHGNHVQIRRQAKLAGPVGTTATKWNGFIKKI